MSDRRREPIDKLERVRIEKLERIRIATLERINRRRGCGRSSRGHRCRRQPRLKPDGRQLERDRDLRAASLSSWCSPN
jgi:hypothetical protein